MPLALFPSKHKTRDFPTRHISNSCRPEASKYDTNADSRHGRVMLCIMIHEVFMWPYGTMATHDQPTLLASNLLTFHVSGFRAYASLPHSLIKLVCCRLAHSNLSTSLAWNCISMIRSEVHFCGWCLQRLQRTRIEVPMAFARLRRISVTSEDNRSKALQKIVAVRLSGHKVWIASSRLHKLRHSNRRRPNSMNG